MCEPKAGKPEWRRYAVWIPDGTKVAPPWDTGRWESYMAVNEAHAHILSDVYDGRRVGKQVFLEVRPVFAGERAGGCGCEKINLLEGALCS